MSAHRDDVFESERAAIEGGSALPDEAGAHATGERQAGLSGIRLRSLHLWDEWEPEACSDLPYIEDLICEHGNEPDCIECMIEGQRLDQWERAFFGWQDEDERE